MNIWLEKKFQNLSKHVISLSCKFVILGLAFLLFFFFFDRYIFVVYMV